MKNKQVFAALALSGRFFTDFYVPTRNPHDNELLQASGSFWLQSDSKLGEVGSMRAILEVDDFEKSLSGTSVRAQLREAYADYAKNGFTLRAGRQIIPWGISDVINPTDFLSAKDYTFLNPDDEVRRIGALSINSGFTPRNGESPLTYTLVWQPVPPQSRLLIPPNVVPAGATLITAPVTPSFTIPNTELAAKIAYNSSAWDTSVSLFRGYHHLPIFAATSTPGTFVSTFDPMKALGTNVSFTSGKWIFRGEAAYSWAEVEPNHLNAVAGVERPVGTDFRVQAQLVWQYLPEFVEPRLDPVNPALAEVNALLLGYQDQSQPGGTFRFSYSNDANGLEAELFVIGNFVGGDYLIRPKLSYAWTDALRTTFGSDYYGGPVDRPLGAQRAFNAVFFEAKYSF